MHPATWARETQKKKHWRKGKYVVRVYEDHLLGLSTILRGHYVSILWCPFSLRYHAPHILINTALLLSPLSTILIKIFHKSNKL